MGGGLGHSVSIWLADVGGRDRHDRTAPRRFGDWFGPFDADVHWGMADWHGADAAIATTWRGIYRVDSLGRTFARVHLMTDHDVERHATSYQRQWADRAYRQGVIR